ncbi:membrane hypothetical protein [Sulfurovum sp. enrichment culture clone C5]|uniref:Acyltransferase 3 domain-containing protein n=1 Tax=Sulfurovum sp. enrichment culture clone C5 TaxID=497650 RepID=A0A0S4XQ37_9BACT|nr:membrane hypothetical protein [Sulfurovum sp. enrichment culture clone C5]
MKINNSLSSKIKGISFILIIMVIYVHSYNILTGAGKSIFLVTDNTANIAIFLQNIFAQGMFRSAVPMFFAISGYLFFKNYRSIRDYSKKIRNRFKTIAIPFIFWSTLVILIYYIAQATIFTNTHFTSAYIRDLGVYGFIEAVFLNPYNYPLWFLRDLMLVVLFAPIVYFGVKKITAIWFISTIALWLLNIGAGTKLFFYKSEAILFFSVGAYFAIYGQKYLNQRMSQNTLLYLAIIYILVLLAKTYMMMLIDTNLLFVISIMQKIIIILGIFLLWNISDYTWISKVVLTNYTFLFYVFHEPLLMLIKKVCFYFLGISGISSIVIYIISPLVTLTFLFFLGILMKSYFPKFTFIIMGGRV